MKEKWLKDIHDRMTDYEVDEPGNLWTDINTKISEESGLSRHHVVRHTVWLWTKRVAAVAALIALIFTIGHYTARVEHQPAPVTAVISHVETDNISNDKNTLNVTGEANAPVVKNTHIPGSANSYLADNAPYIQTVTIPESDSVQVVTSKESVQSEREEQENHPEQNTDIVVHSDYIAQADIRKGMSDRMSFGVLTSGTNGSSLNSRYTSDTYATGIGSDNSDWEDYPLLGMLVYNQGQDVEIDIKHRQPIRFGLTFTYKINNRIAVKSGITYTKLISDMREGSHDNYFADHQTLHYVGIPLNIEYDMFSSSGLDFYFSSGVITEKCVSGELDRTYVLNNQIKQTETGEITVKPLQWSVNASLGMQYDFNSSIGIYAEPGISYYFNNGSSVKTIYNDKSLNFNLNLGIKYTFGKK